MSDSSGNGLQLSHGIAAAIGLALAGVGRALWSALTTSQKERIAVLEAENARKDAVIEKLGAKIDALQDEKFRMAGAINAARARGEDDFGELPTGVRNLVDLMDPRSARKSLDTHPELEGWEPNKTTPPGLRDLQHRKK